ncbi:MAG: hypothetical protein DSZ31_01145 [Gammaproteobacteria bacterium]|nr:MAG: hypothetical protein DSZ31_01145 [Gammaproteobacteria bacterium]
MGRRWKLMPAKCGIATTSTNSWVLIFIARWKLMLAKCGVLKMVVKPLTSNEELIREAVKVIKRHLPAVKVIVFGSRAGENFRENSDLDLALDWGKPIPPYLMEQIREELDELPTLVSFDLVDLNSVSEEFKNQILTAGRIIYDEKTR